MEKLLSSAAPVSLPVIDLSGSRDEVRRAVLHAGKEFGFFQVVNHGMPEQTIREMEAACGDFFRLPALDKAEVNADRLFSGTMYESRSGEESLHLANGQPVERPDPRPGWPDKPVGLRPALEDFIIPARSIGMELLRLLSEGIGLPADYFEGDLSGGDVIIGCSRYPPSPCTDPSQLNYLGLPRRCDPNLITVRLQPGYVCGLQVSYRGGWIDVEPIPSALVVNFGHQMEIATNGLLRSMEHRVVANTAMAKMLVTAFIMPTMDCMVGPAGKLVGKAGTARYQSVAFRDFMMRGVRR